jgi:hypothetical protein
MPMDDIKAARSDLAFLRAVAEDRGPIPALLGWHLVAIGGIFGVALLHVWTVYAGLTPWPEEQQSLLWLPGVLIYAPINALIALRHRHRALGPTARVFGSAWAATGLMTLAAVMVLTVGRNQTGHPFYMVWPGLALVLYGGAWVVIAMILRKPWTWIIAFSCFAAALSCALLIQNTAQWLVMAGAFFLLVGAPGAAIVRASRRASQI